MVKYEKNKTVLRPVVTGDASCRYCHIHLIQGLKQYRSLYMDTKTSILRNSFSAAKTVSIDVLSKIPSAGHTLVCIGNLIPQISLVL